MLLNALGEDAISFYVEHLIPTMFKPFKIFAMTRIEYLIHYYSNSFYNV